MSTTPKDLPVSHAPLVQNTTVAEVTCRRPGRSHDFQFLETVHATRLELEVDHGMRIVVCLTDKEVLELAAKLCPDVFITMHTLAAAFPKPPPGLVHHPEGGPAQSAAKIEGLTRLHKVLDRIKEVQS